MEHKSEDLTILAQVLDSYDLKGVLSALNEVSPGAWSRNTLKLLMKGMSEQFSDEEYSRLQRMLPQPPAATPAYEFDFIDLFAGIGGIRLGFEQAGGRCVFTSEWNPYAVKTYKANHYNDPTHHKFNSDITSITLTANSNIPVEEAYANIRNEIPDHDVLLAGFPCQPFSIAGVSKKNSLGRKHGFEDETQGTLFYDVARIIAAKKPVAFVLENVKNLKSHDRGNTFRIIMKALDELGYIVADADHTGKEDPKIIDGCNFVPQHRERIVLVGFRRDLEVHQGFTLRDVANEFPTKKPKLGEILDENYDQKYILTEKLWEYLFNYSIKHKAKGNGFGYGLVTPEHSTTRTLSARYYKDGSEILIDRGYDHKLELTHPKNKKYRPRKLTPRECARLMGYDAPGKNEFKIPVSDMQAYKQFGNSVVVPVFAAVAKLMKSRIVKGKLVNDRKQLQKLAA